MHFEQKKFSALRMDEGVPRDPDDLARERNLVPKPEPSELELAELVRRAQDFNQAAIDELYSRFRGMIVNLIKTDTVHETLGEDAENIAWEIFYHAVHKINPDHTKHIAGYLKKYVNLKLTDKINAVIKPWEVSSVEENAEAGYEIADKRDEYRDLFENDYLKTEFAKLTPDGQKLMYNLFVKQKSLEECSRMLGRSYNGAAVLRHKCLQQLKKNFEQPGYGYN